MKTSNKFILAAFAVAVSCLDSMAATPGVTFLLANGQKVSFAFASKPEITVGSEEMTVSSTDGVSVSYAFTDVQRFFFEDDVDDNGAGIQGTEDKTSARPVFSYANGVIAVRGLKAGERIAVASVNGSAVASATANQVGTASIDISGVVNGVYVVSTGSGVSFKLLKK